MSDSVYRKTNLPVRLNLNNRNTGVQLKQAPGPENARGALESVSAKESVQDCNEVMRKDLVAWLKAHAIDGPPPSPEAEQRAMWAWIRDFHKEYTEDWFTRNMPRLRDQFRPTFNQELKKMKQAATPAAPPVATSAALDLLDMGGSKNVVPPPNSALSGDLLSLDSLSSSAQPVASQPAPVLSESAPSGDLLEFGSTPYPSQLAVPSQAPEPAGDLLSLDSLSLSSPPVVLPPTPVLADTAAAGDLLCLGSLEHVGKAAGQKEDPLAGLIM